MASLLKVLLTPRFPFCDLTGVGSMDWHIWHSLTTALTALVDTDGLVSRTKSHIIYTPGCPLRWYIFIISSGFSMKAAHTRGAGSSPFFMESNHLWGTWVNLSARLQFNVTKVTSMDSVRMDLYCSYSVTLAYFTAYHVHSDARLLPNVAKSCTYNGLRADRVDKCCAWHLISMDLDERQLFIHGLSGEETDAISSLFSVPSHMSCFVATVTVHMHS